jgi:hypothetical protein
MSKTAINKIISKVMKNSEVLKGLTIEELQERNEFTAASACCEVCCPITIEPTPEQLPY